MDVCQALQQVRYKLGCFQIKQLSEQELARFWSTYVKELAVLLVSVEGSDEPAPEVMGRMKELCQSELLSLYIRSPYEIPMALTPAEFSIFNPQPIQKKPRRQNLLDA